MYKATVTRIDALAPQIRRIQIQPEEHVSTQFVPGAHLDVRLANGLIRSYSLVPCTQANQFEIAVLREVTSRGGSEYLHTSLAIGEEIEISAPKTTFRVITAPMHVFFAAGIGVTPLISLADRVWADGQPLAFHYSVRARSEAAYLDVLAQKPWASTLRLYDGSCGERLQFDSVLDKVPLKTAYFACGPAGYLDMLESRVIERGLQGRLSVERFRQKDLETSGDCFVVECAQSGVSVEVSEGETILSALERVGIDVPYACEEGICGTCITPVCAGEIDHRDSFLTPDEKASQSLIAVCCSRASSSRLVLDL
jgi:vanillate monooxygenase ferredoxin subunit